MPGQKSDSNRQERQTRSLADAGIRAGISGEERHSAGNILHEFLHFEELHVVDCGT